MVRTLVVHGRIHHGHRYHRLHCSDESTGMGIVCVTKGFADPMYIVPSHESYLLHTKTAGGDNDRDPDSGSAKHAR
eukprot:11170367-Lingulodinium_polyedra.AAC.1